VFNKQILKTIYAIQGRHSASCQVFLGAVSDQNGSFYGAL